MVEKKDISLKELVQTILNETLLQKYFWINVVNIISYVLNRVLIRKEVSYGFGSYLE